MRSARAIVASAALALSAGMAFGLSSANWTYVPNLYLGQSAYIPNYLGLCSFFEKVRDVEAAGGSPYDPNPTDTNEYHDVTKYILAAKDKGKIELDPYPYWRTLDILKGYRNNNNAYGLVDEDFPDLSSASSIEKPTTIHLFNDPGNQLSYLGLQAVTNTYLHEQMLDVAYSLYGRRLKYKYRPDSLSEFAGFSDDDYAEPTAFYEMVGQAWGKIPLWYHWVPKVASIFAKMNFYWMYCGDLAERIQHYQIRETTYSYRESYGLVVELVDGDGSHYRVRATITSNAPLPEDHTRVVDKDPYAVGIAMEASSLLDDQVGNLFAEVLFSYDHGLTRAAQREPMTNGLWWSFAEFAPIAVTNNVGGLPGTISYESVSQELLVDNVKSWVVDTDYPTWSENVNRRELKLYVPYRADASFASTAKHGTLNLGDVQTLTNGTISMVRGLASELSSELARMAENRKLSPGIKTDVIEFNIYQPHDMVAIWPSADWVGDPLGYTSYRRMYKEPYDPNPPDDVWGSYPIDYEHNADYNAAKTESLSLSIKAHAFSRERICLDNLTD